VQLGQLRSTPTAAATLAAELDQGGWRRASTRVNACPYIDLRGHSWASYLATLSGEHRYNVQRKQRSLAKRFAVAFEKVVDIEQLHPALDLLIALHQKRWDGHGTSDAFHTPAHVAFHHEFAALALERGWLRLFVLRADGQPASALYGLRYGGVFSFYQSGFDPAYSRHSVGLLTMAAAIQSAIEEGAAEYDFLHGEESYKFHWAKQSRELVRLELYPFGMQGSCAHAFAAAKRWIRSWQRAWTLPALGQALMADGRIEAQ
jgi:CelD/BcsL family acetyltransferase involved in cellulose biosynthesis